MNTTNETARQALFRKIRALLSKTTLAGCTEQEALSAAAIARRLMDDYNIAHADLNEPDEPWTDEAFDWNSNERGRKPRRDAWRLRREIAWAIATYTDTKCRVNVSEGKLKYFGREGDVLFAGWLLESLDAFGIRAFNTFAAAQSFSDEPYTADRESFLLAFAERIKDRLIAESKTRSTGTGSGLIVVRNSLLTAEYARRFPNLGLYHGQRGRMADPTSYNAGSTAGNRAGFHRPMSGSASGPKLLT